MGDFNAWYRKWKALLDERITEASGKPHYTHKTLRRAYLSLKRKMPWLCTFYDYPNLGIPKTNNALEWTFTDIKSKLRVHSGIRKINRSKFLAENIAIHYN